MAIFNTILAPQLRSIHLACACFAAAAPLLAAWLHSRAARGDTHARRAGLRLAAWSLWSLALALVSGLLLGVWNYLNEEDYSGLLVALRRKFEWGLAELAFSAVLGYLFWKWWKATPALPRGKSKLRCSLAVLAATNLLYHFPLLFAVMDQLRINPGLMESPLTSSDFRQLIILPVVYTKALHVVLAGVVLSCLVIIWHERKEEGRLTAIAARVLLAAIVMQLVVGIWMLVVMPAAERDRLVGMGGVAPWLLAIAVILFVAVTQTLIPVAGGEKPGQRPAWLVGLVLAIFLVMSTIAVLQ